MFICVCCLGVLYFRVFESLIHDWMNLPDFSHGFFMPLVSAYLVWDRRHQLKSLEVQPSATGILLLLVGIFLLMIGNLAHESFTMRFSFLVVLSGMVVFLTGWKIFYAFLFPIAYLIFMIPIPSILLQKITFPLQLLVSQLSQHFLEAIGVPILREGNIIILWNVKLEVAEACSGIRSLISILAIGTFGAYLTRKNIIKKAIIILSCIPIAILANVVRVVGTVLLTSKYGSSIAEGFSHDIAGLLTFFLGLLLLILVGVILSLFKHRG